MNFSVVGHYLPQMIWAMVITLELTLASFVVGAILGLLVALARLSRQRALRSVGAGFVSVLLATPVLVQLLWVYYLLPILTGILLPDMFVLILTLSLNQAAVMGENFRAGIQSVPSGQRDAAHTLGLSRVQTFTYVVFPQALRIVLPPTVSSTIVLVKDSSIATFIGVNDLLNVSRVAAIDSFRPLELFTVAAVLYFVLTYPIALAAAWTERRASARR